MFSKAKKTIGSKLYNLDIKVRRKTGNTVCKMINTSIRFSYLEAGKGDETIVFLHGFSDHKDNIFRIAQGLTSQYKVIIPDLPGFGEYDNTPCNAKYDVIQYASWIIEFTQKLGIEKCHFFGHSLGAAIAMQIACDYPDNVQSLGLLNSGGVVTDPPTGIYTQLLAGKNLFQINTREEFDSFIKANVEKMPYTPESVKHFLFTEYHRHRHWYGKIMQDLMGDVLEFPLPPTALNNRMHEIAHPTVIIWSEKDQLTTLEVGELMHQSIINSQLHIIPGIGHCAHFEKPKAVTKIYRSFLSEL